MIPSPVSLSAVCSRCGAQSSRTTSVGELIALVCQLGWKLEPAAVCRMCVVSESAARLALADAWCSYTRGVREARATWALWATGRRA